MGLLLVLILSVWGLEDTIKEGNLTQEDKAQIVEQKEIDKKVSDYNEQKNNERIQLLLNSSWDEIENNDKVEWALTNAIDNFWVKILFIAFIVISFVLFTIKRIEQR